MTHRHPIVFVDFDPEAFAAFVRAQAGAGSGVANMAADPEVAAQLDVPGLARLALDSRDGAVVGGGGVRPTDEWRAVAWSWYDRPKIPRRAWRAIFAESIAILRRAHAAGYVRIEGEVLFSSTRSKCWAQRLGFHFECARPGDAAGTLYAQVARHAPGFFPVMR